MKSCFSKSLIYIFILVILVFLGCSSPDEKKQAFIEKGNSLYDQGDFIKAKLEFKNAIQIDPEFAQAYYRLGETEVKLKNLKQAYGMIMKSVDLDPDNLNARIILGKILLSGKVIGRAEEQADEILARDKKNLGGNLLKASVCFANKEYAQGEKILLELYNSGITSPDMFSLLVAVSNVRKNKSKMRAYLEEGLVENPFHIPLLLGFARFEANQKNFNEVELIFKKIIELKPDVIQYQLNLAKVYLSRNKNQDAENILDQVIIKNSQDEKVRMGIAGFWLSVNKIEKAETIIKKGLELNPNSFRYRLFFAEIYAKTKRIDEAEKLLRQTLEINPDPGNPEIIKTKIGLAKLLLITGRLRDGEAFIDDVIKNDPKNLDAHFVKGMIYLSGKDGANAIPEFRMMVEDRPLYAKGHLNLAKAHILNMEYDLAADVLERAYKKMPKATVFLKSMAKLNILRKDPDAAEDNLLMIVKANPENLQSMVDLGDFYLASANYEKALNQYRKIKEKKPVSEAYLRIASVYMVEKKYDKALEELKTAYGNGVSSPAILTTLVKLYIKNKDYKPAVMLCNERLKKNEKEAFTWNLLGSIYLVQNQFKKAKSAIEKAIEMQPEWDKPHDNLARIYLFAGEKKLAIEKFNTALEKNPNNIAAWMTLGSLYEKDKAYAKAAKNYKQAFERNPHLWAAANNYAFIKSEFGESADLQQGLEYARKAEKLNPNAGVVLDTLGWLNFKIGNIEKAYEQVKKAVEQLSDNNILNYHMGMILDKQGKIGEAKLYLEKALVFDSEFIGSEIARNLLDEYNTKKY